jgi:MoaA/NifB/PqqE/SkfB family radical SAM enzyme
MFLKLTKRMLVETDLRLLRKFAYNFGWKGMRAVHAFEKRLRKGEVFPAFLFLSITNNCNLSCQGCWVSPTTPPRELSLDTIENIIVESKKRGSYMFGILGGEPLLHQGIFTIMERHPDCYFILFSNGTTITDKVAAELRRLGNVTPLISIEGTETVSDERRGGEGVYGRTLHGLQMCREHHLITGVATSICKSNFDDLVSEDFVNKMVKQRVHYLWYYIYRPTGANPSPELALSKEQIREVRRFIVDIRTKAPIMIVDAYWDHKGRAVCPAAMGISHHISPAGDVEPCPPIQFARDNIGNAVSIYDIITRSELLAEFRALARWTTRGCIILDNPQQLLDFMLRQEAVDTSGRGTGREELERMIAQASHDMAGEEIPEKHWMYKFAKKHWFFGFGAYG